MPLNWRWLFLTALLTFKAPQFVVDPNGFLCEDYNELPFPGTNSQLFCRSGDQLLKDQMILQIGSGMDFVGEGTSKSTASIPIKTPQIQLDICPLADICLESDRPSTGNVSFGEANEMMDSVSLDMNFMSILLGDELHLRAYIETIIKMLPEAWQPGPVCLQGATMVMSMASALDVLMILLFIWRRIKSRINRLSSKKLEQFMDRFGISRTRHQERNHKECVRELKKDVMTLRQREDRMKRAELFKKKFQPREPDLHQMLREFEQVWTERLEEAMEECRKNAQRLKECRALDHKLRKTLHLCEM